MIPPTVQHAATTDPMQVCTTTPAWPHHLVPQFIPSCTEGWSGRCTSCSVPFRVRSEDREEADWPADGGSGGSKPDRGTEGAGGDGDGGGVTTAGFRVDGVVLFTVEDVCSTEKEEAVVCVAIEDVPFTSGGVVLVLGTAERV